MDEDKSLATLLIICLAITMVGCCLGVWFKLRKEREDEYLRV
jgi:hypothetical protein